MLQNSPSSTALETKYRDIADGNRLKARSSSRRPSRLETSYRDIADGNSHSWLDLSTKLYWLETSYRDIADGNTLSGNKIATENSVGNQVPRYSGWKLPQHLRRFFMLEKLETKHRKIADRTVYLSPLIYKQRSCRASRFLNAQRHHPCTPPPTAWSDWAKPNKQARLDNLKSSSITMLTPPVRSIKRQSS